MLCATAMRFGFRLCEFPPESKRRIQIAIRELQKLNRQAALSLNIRQNITPPALAAPAILSRLVNVEKVLAENSQKRNH
jgi:hypothetical protein